MRVIDSNLFQVFKYTDTAPGMNIGGIITQKAFDTFIGSNQPKGTRLIEEEVTFPHYIFGGATRPGLVHYTPDGKKFAVYVPAFATEAETQKYEASFRR